MGNNLSCQGNGCRGHRHFRPAAQAQPAKYSAPSAPQLSFRSSRLVTLHFASASTAFGVFRKFRPQDAFLAAADMTTTHCLCTLALDLYYPRYSFTSAAKSSLWPSMTHLLNHSSITLLARIGDRRRRKHRTCLLEGGWVESCRKVLADFSPG